ncbi:MAG: hypothetical protein OEY01_03685 [Desulfobulbaceae bacterium]|nr:hypothetical protein [Desulfobulbaceae bacterium]
MFKDKIDLLVHVATELGSTSLYGQHGLSNPFQFPDYCCKIAGVDITASLNDISLRAQRDGGPVEELFFPFDQDAFEGFLKEVGGLEETS